MTINGQYPTRKRGLHPRTLVDVWAANELGPVISTHFELRLLAHGTGQRHDGILQAEAVQATEKERDRLEGRRE